MQSARFNDSIWAAKAHETLLTPLLLSSCWKKQSQHQKCQSSLQIPKSSGPIVSSSGLAENKVVWAEKLSKGSSSNTVHGAYQGTKE